MNIQTYDFNKNGRTHKSLGINEVADDVTSNDVETPVFISSGNYIGTFLGEIRQRGLEERIQVVNLSNHRLGLECQELLIDPTRVLRDAKEREQYVRERLGISGKVKDYTDFTPKAYETKAGVILEGNPDYVSLGVGSGKLFLALRKVIKQKGLKTRLIGILPRGENGVFNDDNLYEDSEGNLHYKTFEPKSLADKLVCPYTFYKPELLQAQREGHILIEADNKDFKRANKAARKKGLESEVSGSAGFVVLDPKIRQKYNIPEDSSIVLVNTGRGYDWERIQAKEKRSILAKVTTALATAASVLVGAYLMPRSPTKQELAFADLNKNGSISTEEIVECHKIVGTFSRTDPNKKDEAYDQLQKSPWIDTKTLQEMKRYREILVAEVRARYHDDLKPIRERLPGVKFEWITDLSYNQLKYLSERAQFDDLTNPEFYRARLHKIMQASNSGLHVEPWEVK